LYRNSIIAFTTIKYRWSKIIQGFDILMAMPLKAPRNPVRRLGGLLDVLKTCADSFSSSEDEGRSGKL